MAVDYDFSYWWKLALFGADLSLVSQLVLVILLHSYVAKFVRKGDRGLLTADAKYTNLYAKNLDPEVTEEVLQEKFSEFGKVTSWVIAKNDDGTSRGFGFVNFENPDDAKKATETLNGTQLGKLQCSKKLSRGLCTIRLSKLYALIQNRLESSVCSQGAEKV